MKGKLGIGRATAISRNLGREPRFTQGGLTRGLPLSPASVPLGLPVLLLHCRGGACARRAVFPPPLPTSAPSALLLPLASSSSAQRGGGQELGGRSAQ